MNRTDRQSTVITKDYTELLSIDSEVCISNHNTIHSLLTRHGLSVMSRNLLMAGGDR